MASAPKVGEPAPDFTLDGTKGPFTLSDHKGERVILLFYPGDETPVCTKQFCSYRDSGGDFNSLGATVVGISTQDVASHQRFTAHHGLTVPLLADTDRKVADLYGVGSKLAGSKRSVFIIGPDGRVAFRKIHALSLGYMDADALRDALKDVPERAAA